MLHPPIRHALTETLGLFAFRAAPIVAAYLLGAGSRVWAKAVVAVLYLGVVAVGPWDARGIALVACAYLYFAMVGCSLPAMARGLASGHVTRGACFVTSTVCFFVVPSLVMPPLLLRAALFVVCWDLVLASYSYSVETSSQEQKGSLRDCLFFLLVNPALVYARRGVRSGPPELRLDGLARAALGLGAMFGTVAFLLPLGDHVRKLASDATHFPFWMAACACLGFLLAYVTASGLASLQIGLLRLFGYEIPERFSYPLLARDPKDFWRRWNTYVTGWLERYVFSPVAAGFRRRRGPQWSHLPYVVATLATFAVTGLLHDGFFAVTGFALHWRATIAFVAGAVVMVIWRPWNDLVTSLLERPAASLVMRATFWMLLLSIFGWWKA